MRSAPAAPVTRSRTLVESLVQDLKLALRTLRKAPGFTVVAVGSLALGIGANAVVFGVLNGLILRPLHVPRAQSLFAIEGSDQLPTQSYPNYLDLRDRNRTFDGLAAFNTEPAGFSVGGEATRAWVLEATGNYFDVLGIQPCLGRFFHGPDEHGPNSAPYVVLSYAYWHNHFHGDPAVVGRTVGLNKHPFTVLGVAPPAFQGVVLFFSPDAFVPLVDQAQIEGANQLDERGARRFMVFGHLKAGITPEQATADLNAIGASLAKSYPQADDNMSFRLAPPGLYGDYLGGPVRGFVTGLMLLAGLILLATCANLGGLFAARAAERSREVALRLALGSSRVRVLQQLGSEAVLISVAGGGVGLLSGIILLRWLSVWQPVPRYPINLPVGPDITVYGIALGLSIISCLLFGAFPVRQILRTQQYEVIKAGSTAGPGHRWSVRDALLVLQIAICALLVTSSIVAFRGLARSLHANLGFEPANATLVETDLTMGGYTLDRAPALQRRMINAAERIPGVTAVGLMDQPPLYEGWDSSDIYADETTDLKPSNAAGNAVLFRISPAYFRAAGTTLLAGRPFSWHDDANTPRVAVVNREFARRMFGSVAQAIGRFYKLSGGARIQVVGVVEDGRYKSLAEDNQIAMFFPILQSPSNQTLLVVRSTRDPRQLTSAIAEAIRGLDPGLPFSIRTWYDELDTALFASRMATLALGVLGLLGAMLAITGTFGMGAYSVTMRLRELGIRAALGAQRLEVLQAALSRAVKVLTIGSATGLLLGLLGTRLLAAIVYQATPRDPVVLSGVVIAMSILGLVATWIPAQRALAVDPARLLRED